MERKQLNWVLVTWIVASLLILLAFLVAYLHSKATESDLARQFNHEQLIVAKVTAQGMTSLFSHLERELAFTCAQEEMKDLSSPIAKREIRKRYLEFSNLIEELYVVDGSGDVLFSARGSEITSGFADEVRRLTLILLSNQPVGVSDLHDISGGDGKISIAMPVKGGGVFRGSLVASLRISKITNQHLLEIISTENSYAWVIDDKGVLISNPKHPEMTFNNVFVSQGGCARCHKDMKLERRMAGGLSGTGELLVKTSTKKLVAYHPARLGQKTWSVAVAAPYSEVTKLARRSFGYTVVLLVLIVGALLGGAALVSRAGSEKIRAEERTKWTEYALQSERLATIGRMSAKVAHEIRNPLTSIALNADLLRDEIEGYEGVDSSEAKSLLRSVGNEVDRLKKVMDEYLQFARLPKLRGETVNVSALLFQLIDFLKEELELNRIKLATNMNRFLPPVAGDSNQLKQAFMNVVRNGMEAMPKGGELRISTQANEGRIEVEISDTGVGIHDENIEKVFVPFFSTKEQGTGLGLSVAREIVREHGGEITVKSVPGHGTTFLLTLPVGQKLPRLTE